MWRIGSAQCIAFRAALQVCHQPPGSVAAAHTGASLPVPQATYDKALHLVELYVNRGVDPKRLYIKVRADFVGYAILRVCTTPCHWNTWV